MTESDTNKIEFDLIKYQFYSTALADILKAIEGGAYTGAFILSFCCIDYMGLAIQPDKKKHTREDFKSFIHNYMSKVNPKYVQFTDYLYAVRCSLVHNYGPSAATNKMDIMPNLIFSNPYDFVEHLVFNKIEKKLNISLSNFVSELFTAVELFFKEMTNNLAKLKKWHRRLFYHYGLTVAREKENIRNRGKVIFEEIHPILKVFDDKSEIVEIYSTLRNDIELKIKNI